jgi:hypothetical protein
MTTGNRPPLHDTQNRVPRPSRVLCERAGFLDVTIPFWQPRYYDFNDYHEQKLMEKLDYVHLNPVRRGLVAVPEDWTWSSARHYATGEECGVEIESHRTARRRKQFGMYPAVGRRGIS